MLAQMSRSYKKSIYKDVGSYKKIYWKIIRREWKMELKSKYYFDDFQLRNYNEICNFYNYSDHKVNMELYSRYYWSSIKYDDFGRFFELHKKLSRK